MWQMRFQINKKHFQFPRLKYAADTVMKEVFIHFFSDASVRM